MATKKIPFVHRITGDVRVVSRKHASKLNEDWSEVEFTKNEDGKHVMRIQLQNATVDVLENEDDQDGIADTE